MGSQRPRQLSSDGFDLPGKAHGSKLGLNIETRYANPLGRDRWLEIPIRHARNKRHRPKVRLPNSSSSIHRQRSGGLLSALDQMLADFRDLLPLLRQRPSAALLL